MKTLSYILIGDTFYFKSQKDSNSIAYIELPSGDTFYQPTFYSYVYEEQIAIREELENFKKSNEFLKCTNSL